MKKLAGFAVLATFAVLGMPSLVSASATVTCDAHPLIAAPPTANAQLGWSLSQNQGWLAAGANQDIEARGSVAMYLNPSPGAGPTEPELRPSDLQPGDQFGSAVSISGLWMAVGAPGKAQNSGAVYLFKFDGTSWVQMAPTLSAADAAQGAQFGFSVALNVSLSGARLVVGAPGDSDRGSLAGSAYVFEMQGNSWNQTMEIHAGDGRPFDEFGFAVATAGDNLVVGAPFADDTPHNVLKNFGAAYVFNAGNASNGWTQSARLTADDTFRGDNIQFGLSVAMSGGQILVGAPGDDLHNLTDSGSAFVFAFGQTQTGSSGWTRLLSLTPEDPHPGAQFGSSVLIDGDRLLIGARFDGVGNIGAAYLFDSGSGAQIEKVIGPAPGGAFGQSVAALGDQVFMGGYLDDVGDAAHAGAVSVCPLGTPTPQPVCTKTGPSVVEAGGLAVYIVTVGNQGGAPATGLMLKDPTSESLPLVSVVGGACSQLPCSLGTIATGGSSNPVTVTFRVPDGCAAPRSFTDMAMVTGGVNPINCTPQIPTTVIRPPVRLSCHKQGSLTAQPGDIVTYDIAVSNSGCEAAKNVMLSDPTPAGLSLVSVSGPCTELPCNLGTIRPGETLPPVKTAFNVSCAALG